ncbi:aminotransferase class V-fold PLP-dependent enzyme [Portibacter marinus]|uniref:aminotransferase class V-fold PLP-dependent enzyme n=1 Tax=Portibacter marinus TaxID=2898660 RepID=UPI001F4708E7|nr:aminotransferase class V-fold PLP-dependent enzyme [Portibacter marinus]
MSLEQYFNKFRSQITGIDHQISTPQGRKPLVYADWIASGRMYDEIEEKVNKLLSPIVANTHTETSYTGTVMTNAYHQSKQIIKNHVNADEKDVILFVGSGMTGAINKLQRIMGLKVFDRTNAYLESTSQQGWLDKLLGRKADLPQAGLSFKKNAKPVVFITHMEHHSNHTCWLETIVDLEVIASDENGLVDLNHFSELLEKYKDRTWKIASVTAASNVTGIIPPYYEMAEMIHNHNGFCFVDFACSAPYVKIDMHPKNPKQALDAVFFSPHKFLGGPGTPGIVVFNSKLYSNKSPDNPGGGTVVYTSPWTMHDYIDDIEAREDGGTPPFMQGIRAALAIQLKDQMDPDKIQAREHELLDYFFDGLNRIDNISILAGQHKKRLGVISFVHKFVHYNLYVRLLNDFFGIQVRGGCACAGTYGHYLLEINQENAYSLRAQILKGDSLNKPGWVRLSIHPTMTNKEAAYILDAIKQVSENAASWSKDYTYQPSKNEFLYIGNNKSSHEAEVIEQLFQTTAQSQPSPSPQTN